MYLLILLGGAILGFLVCYSGINTQKDLRKREKYDPEYKQFIDKLNKK